MDIDGPEAFNRSPSVKVSQMDLDDYDMDGLYGPPVESMTGPATTVEPLPRLPSSQRPQLRPRPPSQMPHLDLLLAKMGSPWPAKVPDGATKRLRKGETNVRATMESTTERKLVNFTRFGVRANLLAAGSG